MSKNQCTHQAILDIFIIITKGVKIIQIFLYHAKNNQVKKAKDTAAWSLGKLASGICFKIGVIRVSGLSKKKKY
jgi:hypothetical protein